LLGELLALELWLLKLRHLRSHLLSHVASLGIQTCSLVLLLDHACEGSYLLLETLYFVMVLLLLIDGDLTLRRLPELRLVYCVWRLHLVHLLETAWAVGRHHLRKLVLRLVH